MGLSLGEGGGGGVKQGRFSQKVASPLVGPPKIVVGPPCVEQGRFSAKVAAPLPGPTMSAIESGPKMSTIAPGRFSANVASPLAGPTIEGMNAARHGVSAQIPTEGRFSKVVASPLLGPLPGEAIGTSQGS